MYKQNAGVYKKRPLCSCCGIRGTNKQTCPWNPENSSIKSQLLAEKRHKQTRPASVGCK